jgi:hypothetical protein
MGGTRTSGRALMLWVVAMAAVGLPGVADADEASDATPAAAGTHIVLAGDFTGDGFDDVLIFGKGAAPDVLWDFGAGANINLFCEPSSAVERPITINSTATPVVGEFTGDNVDDIFWYGPGGAVDRLWDFNASPTLSYTGRSFSVGGSSFRPFAGDLSADGVEDLIWYAPGTTGDVIWDFNSGGGYTRRALSVNGTYRPVVGRFSPDSKDDIFWYAPGSGRESMWSYWDNSFRPLVESPPVLQVSGTYTTVVTDTWGEGREDIVFAAPGAAQDHLWDFFGFWELFKSSLPAASEGGSATVDTAFTQIVAADYAPNVLGGPPFTPHPYGDLVLFDDFGVPKESFNSEVNNGDHLWIESCIA